MAHAVEVKSLNKEFQNGGEVAQILHDINLELELSRLSFLVGPSGCGKTTLISIISGILTPTTGDVQVMGRSLIRMKDQERVLFRRSHIGFIFQQYNLLPALTAAENSAMPLVVAGMPLELAVEKSKVILQQIGMAAYLHKLPNQLSGGQQQRVAIARALVHSPNLIVCDEPTAALDGKAGQEVMGILREVSQDPSRAVLVVTHDSRIYSFADQITEMNDGRIIGHYTADSYIQKERALWQNG